LVGASSAWWRCFRTGRQPSGSETSTTSRYSCTATCDDSFETRQSTISFGRASYGMSLVCLQHGVGITRESDNSLSISAPCLPRRPPRLAFLHPCLPAAMRYETTTPTKTHLGRYHTLHHPSHPTLASGLVCRKYGSIDGPSSSYLFLFDPLSQFLQSTTTWIPREAKHSRHVQPLNRRVLP
jgi:hypothetical protein